MIHKILVAGDWRDAGRPGGSFSAMNPATGKHLPDAYPVSPWPDILAALEAGRAAVDGLMRGGPDKIAAFLEGFAGRVEGLRETLVEMAQTETALPAEPRLRSVEFPRLVDQLRQAARACRDRSWCRATIDTKANIRSKFGPLGGPVVIFSPNNFPFAFNSVGGGDFGAAMAAGNPVIAKANPGHPGTSRIMAEAAFESLRNSGLPGAAVQLLFHFSGEDGARLVSHPFVGATAFTGSRPSGLRLKEAADRAGKPIYLEMSSSNPVLILPGALEERLSDIAGEVFNSCLLGAGQFCTRPGMVILFDNPRSREFLGSVRAAFEGAVPGYALSRRVLEALKEACTQLQKAGAELVTGGRELPGPGFRFSPTLFRVPGAEYLRNPAAFQVEPFGSLALFVFTHDLAEMIEVTNHLGGQLTGTIYSHGRGNDDLEYEAIEPVLRRKVGRLLNDRMPTGVAVSPAMSHGGPYPATGHPGFTSVGIPASIVRFAALQCYDNVRPHRLPPELRDENPTGRMWRSIDGAWTQR
jgi:NADP-dependent aldehyde dehydrogenase